MESLRLAVAAVRAITKPPTTYTNGPILFPPAPSAASPAAVTQRAIFDGATALADLGAAALEGKRPGRTHVIDDSLEETAETTLAGLIDEHHWFELLADALVIQNILKDPETPKRLAW